MLKNLIIIALFLLVSNSLKSTKHEILVWNGYMQFMPSNLTSVQLGDTIEWHPLDVPTMVHTVTSTNIPNGAIPFDQIWQAPADTFFQYIPAKIGLYEYVCTPHIANGMRGRFNVVGNPSNIINNPFINSPILYPNPTIGLINFNQTLLNLEYHIYDIRGLLVLKGISKTNIDISHLSSGLYNVIILADVPKCFKLILNTNM